MIKWLNALVFTIFILNCNSDTFWNSQTPIEVAVNVLAEITDNKKTLPLPLCVVPGRRRLQLRPPEEMVKAEIENRVMVWGTEFFHRDSQAQLYFCPSRILNESCLEPMEAGEFNNSVPLVCTEEPKADVVWDSEVNRRICNIRDGIFSHRVIYKICPSLWYQYHNTEFSVYQFCYDEINTKTLFTRHSIFSPNLIFSPLLIREHQLQYPYEEPTDQFVPANHNEIINAENNILLPRRQRNSILRLRYNPQRLVPADDMALAVLKKTTSKAFNFKLQHENVAAVWGEINQKLRVDANLKRTHVTYIISTGVFDNQKKLPHKPDGQMYNRWIKLIIGRSPQDNRLFGGSVFIINNFIDREFEYHPFYLKLLQSEMQDYCSRDYCTNEFKNLAENGDVTVRCCEVTKKIGKLFDYDFETTLEFIPIEGLSEFTTELERSSERTTTSSP